MLVTFQNDVGNSACLSGDIHCAGACSKGDDPAFAIQLLKQDIFTKQNRKHCTRKMSRCNARPQSAAAAFNLPTIREFFSYYL